MSAPSSSHSRVAAAGLLAVSAGACFGVALAPSVSNLYTPSAVAPAVASQPALSNARYAVPSVSHAQMSGDVLPRVAASETSQSVISSWTMFAGVLSAAAAAVTTYVLTSGSKSSEQIAMIAAAGKKKAPAAQGERKLWYPTAEAPEWLDGTMPGDRGFDPWGLAKPVEYLQVGFDGLDQNKAVNKPGQVIGKIKTKPDEIQPGSLQPYSEVFGIQRFRECELIHGRWAMLAVLGCLVGEAVTGVGWQNAGLYEVTNGATYWGNPLPFTGTQVTWFEVLSMGFVEIQRNTEFNLEKRCYPGGAFDPLGLTRKNDETTFKLKEAELKHGRLAMIAFLGFAAASGKTGLGATEAFNAWATSFF